MEKLTPNDRHANYVMKKRQQAFAQAVADHRFVWTFCNYVEENRKTIITKPAQKDAISTYLKAYLKETIKQEIIPRLISEGDIEALDTAKKTFKSNMIDVCVDNVLDDELSSADFGYKFKQAFEYTFLNWDAITKLAEENKPYLNKDGKINKKAVFEEKSKLAEEKSIACFMDENIPKR